MGWGREIYLCFDICEQSRVVVTEARVNKYLSSHVGDYSFLKHLCIICKTKISMCVRLWFDSHFSSLSASVKEAIIKVRGKGEQRKKKKKKKINIR